MRMDHQGTDPIRQAIAAGEFQRAMLLWNEYVAAILEEIRQGTCTQARMIEASELLEWACNVVQCDRAHAQSQLNTIWAASQYDPSGSTADTLVRVTL